MAGSSVVPDRLRRLIRGAAAALACLAFALVGAPLAEARDDVVESFDGTPIVVHFYPGEGSTPANPQPTIMIGPGWSLSGGTKSGDAFTSRGTPGGIGGAFGVSSLGVFLDAGYNVLTWDPRGFGGSGGTVQINDPEFEGRDMQALLDFVADQPEAELDEPGDPVAGMAGGSYGGGIQFVTAGVDRRVDAIAPTIAWHSLESALFQDDSLKMGWGSILIAAGIQGASAPGIVSPAGPQFGFHDPHFISTMVEGAATGRVSPDNKDWFRSKGPDFLMRRVKIPTLIIQGTVDTLFTLDEAVRNFRILNNNTRRTGQKNARRNIPVKMIWFCGGHGACFTGDVPAGYLDRRQLAWFDRYLRKDRGVRTGKRFAWVADDGVLRRSSRFPGRKVGAMSATGSGVLALEPGPSGGGGGIFATQAPVAVNVPIPGPDAEANALGAPKLKLTYSGVAVPARTFTYAQIVNPRNGQILGNVTTPIPLTLDGSERTIRRKLEMVAGRLPAGGGYTLQLAPDSTVYDIQRSVGAVDFSEIKVRIPLREPVRHGGR